MTVFCYVDGQPEMETVYTGPGRHHRDQVRINLEHPVKTGEKFEVHMGHGIFHEYEVMLAVDNMALADRVSSRLARCQPRVQ